MPDLISREALLPKVEYDEYYHSNEIRDIANDTPTVDAVPVVRCEECRYFRAANIPSCASPYGIIDPEPDDFCSYGERRNDDAAD